MVSAAESDGSLKPGMTIVEPTSGNTGIALAFVAAAKGYGCILTMPNTMSLERRMLMKSLGAQVILTDGSKGIPAAIQKAEEIIASDPTKYWGPRQFENPANPEVHEHTTGPEIWEDTDGAVDILVSGVGTGGTITGISRYLKNTRGKNVLSVALEPDSTTMITAAKAGDEPRHGPHKIQGIGAGFVHIILIWRWSIRSSRSPAMRRWLGPTSLCSRRGYSQVYHPAQQWQWRIDFRSNKSTGEN